MPTLRQSANAELDNTRCDEIVIADEATDCLDRAIHVATMDGCRVVIIEDIEAAKEQVARMRDLALRCNLLRNLYAEDYLTPDRDPLIGGAATASKRKAA